VISAGRVSGYQQVLSPRRLTQAIVTRSRVGCGLNHVPMVVIALNRNVARPQGPASET
jgi:hypothetical protein